MPDAIESLSQEELDALKRQARSIQQVARAAERVASGKPNSADGLLAAAKIWELANVPRRATEIYERATRMDTDAFEAAARLAITLVRSGRGAEALRVAVDLANRAPEFRFRTLTGSLTISSMTVLGDAFRSVGDDQSAVTAYERATRIVPEDTYSLGRLAELYLVQERVDEAVALEPQLDASYFAGLKAGLRLAGNDLRRLPALTGLRLNLAAAGNVAA